MFDLQAARDILGKVDNPRTLLEGLFLHAPIPVQIYDPKGHSLFVNEAFFRMFGAVPPPEYCVLKDELARANGVDVLFRQAFSGKVTTIPPTWYDCRELEHVKLSEGRRVAIETFCIPILGPAGEVRYVVFMFREVTAEQQLELERKSAVRKLEEANLLIERLMNGTKAVIYAKDLEGRLLFVNNQYGRVVGLEPSALIGRLVEELHPPEVAARFRANDLIAMDGRGYLEAEESVQHPDGTTHDYISQKFPLRDGDGRVYGVCGISTDITQLRRLEKELGQARRMESLGVLAGGVAHDFNNLLGMILLHTEALARRCVHCDHGVARDLEQIRFSVERATGLVRQLLAFGRRLPMAPRPLDLNQLVRGHSYMIGKLTGESARLVVELEPGRCVALADSGRIEQVLLNLCVNSRDAIGPGGQITIRTGRARVDGPLLGMQLKCAPGDYATLEVSDDGQGMSREVLDRAFDPFFTTKSRTQGSGLGLSTVFGIVQESGGGLLARSEPGRGCSVKVFLPFTEQAVQESVEGAVALKSQEVGAPVCVLLVEDEKLLREITARQLRMEGYTVIEAGSGPEARERLAAHPEVQVLVCDVIMPGMTGPALVKGLADEGLLRDRGVLFITGYSSEELEGKGFHPASMHLLEKPFTTRGLVEMIGTAHAAAIR